jgi:hypothetical protein
MMDMLRTILLFILFTGQFVFLYKGVMAGFDGNYIEGSYFLLVAILFYFEIKANKE